MSEIIDPLTEAKKIQKQKIEPNEFKPSESFHELQNKDNIPNNINTELLNMKGKKLFI